MANPGSPKTIYTGAPSNKGLVVQGTVSQAANLQEWQVSTGTPVTYVDPAGNLVGPSNGSVIPTQFASTRHLMATGRYNLAPNSSMPPYGGPDFVAATSKSDVSVVQSARNVMWQFHDTDIQNTSDRAMVNFNVVQRYNTIGSLALTQPGDNYTAPPTIIILNDPQLSQGSCTLSVAQVTVTNGGSGYDPNNPPQPIFNGGGGNPQATGMTSVDPNPPHAVTGVTVLTSGHGYTSVPTISFSGTDMGARATAVLQVDAVTIPAVGYVSPLISFEGGGGTGAAATTTLTVQSVMIPPNGGGSGYDPMNPPTVMFSAPPPTATASGMANISGGGVIGVTILGGGVGYRTPPTVTFSYGNAKAVAYIDTNGSVASVAIINPGTSYDPNNPPTVTFSMVPMSTMATGNATVSPNPPHQVTGITVMNQGAGYTSAPTITIAPPPTAPPGGTGASAYAVMQLGSVVPYPRGLGYTSLPMVNVTGNGVGSQASVTCNITGGLVDPTQITIANAGGGYFCPPPIVFAGGGGYHVATATAVLARVGRTGVEIDTYTQPDNGGEISGLLVVQAGGGNAITCYKMSETGRLPGFDNYFTSHGMAIECATADPWYAIECGAGGFGSSNIGGCIMLRLGNAGAKGLLVTPEVGTYDGRIAYAIGAPQVGAPDSNITFAVQLNGNISTQGLLGVGGQAGLLSANTQATILPSADNVKGLVVRAHSSNQVYNLQEWQDASGNLLASIGANGSFAGSMDTQAASAPPITVAVKSRTVHKIQPNANGNITADSGGVVAQEMTLLIVNAAVAGYIALTLINPFKASGPVSIQSPGQVAVLRFVSDGTNWWEVCRTVGLGP